MSAAVIDAINSAMDECRAAQRAGDYATALTCAESAWIDMCRLPDSEFENERLEWKQDQVQQLLSYLKQRKADTHATDSTGGRGAIIRPVPITYERG